MSEDERGAFPLELLIERLPDRGRESHALFLLLSTRTGRILSVVGCT